MLRYTVYTKFLVAEGLAQRGGQSVRNKLLVDLITN